MLIIDGSTIRLTRGDSAAIQCRVYTPDGDDYTLEPGDVMIFTLRKHAKGASDDGYLLRKTFVGGEINLEPADTARLAYGQYFYDIELRLTNGSVNTVVPFSAFIIEKEVT